MLAGLSVLVMPAYAWACVAGMYYEKPVGDFEAEMSYAAYRLKPGEEARFHLDLMNVSSDSYGPGNPIPYDVVRVTLRDGVKVVAEGAVERVDFAETSFDVSLPKKNADYVLDVEYAKGEGVLATVSFPVRVGFGNWRSYFGGGERSALLAGVTVRRE